MISAAFMLAGCSLSRADLPLTWYPSLAAAYRDEGLRTTVGAKRVGITYLQDDE